MKKEFYIIRHGQTDLNKQGIVQGKGVDADINRLGEQQAQAFYEAYSHIRFDKVYTSSLKRTEQTVKRFIQNGIPWQRHAGFDEIGWGVYEGLAQDEKAKAAFVNIIDQWRGGAHDVAVEGGETPNQVKRRLQRALQDIVAKPDEQTILICMHGRALRMFLCLLSNCSFSKMDDFPHDNTVLYRVVYDGQGFEIVDFYNTDHLRLIK